MLDTFRTTITPFGDDYEITDGVVTKYVSFPALGVIAKRVGTGMDAEDFWLHTDHLGSVQSVTGALGDEVFRRSYRAYGETIDASGTTTESRGWIDQRQDAETGLAYLHSRYYDPEVGLFLSPDTSHPARLGVGANRYAYAGGNPVNATDRSGRQWVYVCTSWKTRQNRDGSYSPTDVCAGGSMSWVPDAVERDDGDEGDDRHGGGGGGGGGGSGGSGGSGGTGGTGGDGGDGGERDPETPEVVRVYSSDAFGVDGVNHAFVWSTELNRGKGTDGSSWVTNGDGVGPLDSPYLVVELPPGMSSEEFMRAIEGADGWNNYVWVPFVNDCHTDLANAFEQAGVEYPGAPNGRMDSDDSLVEQFDLAMDLMRQGLRPRFLARLSARGPRGR